MITAAKVRLWNQDIGAVSWDVDRDVASFEYEPRFLNKGYHLSPIMMPISQSKGRIWTFPTLRKNETFKGMPGLLADILPDKYGNALINAWLIKNGRITDSLNPVETLCFIGKRGMGALEIEPSLGEMEAPDHKIEIGSLVEMAERILSERENFRVNISKKEEKSFHDIIQIGSSAGGARAKALIAFHDGTMEVRSGQADAPSGFSQWIIKFDGIDDMQLGNSKGYGRVEMAYHKMATAAEIEMTECRLLDENGRSHFMTKRFDRDPLQGKIHIQSFCALRHFDYNDVGLYSYEQLFETLRMLRLPYPQAEQLYRRMVFNVMSRNCDDHTKNFGFIMDKSGTWKLSPAYDICFAYRESSPWVSQHSLSINGKRMKISREDLLVTAKQVNVKGAEQIIDQIQTVIKEWKHYAAEVGVEPNLSDHIRSSILLL